MDTAPIAIVDVVGVKKRGWIFANLAGSAWYAAIERVVRAVGRMVVWVEAPAEHVAAD
jgi:hypothetical protein